MPTKKRSSDPVVYQLKVSLKYTSPPIWRRIQVTGNTTLAKLHKILQVIMGWDDSHLHQFIVRGTYYSEPFPDVGFDFGLEKKNERNAKLSQIVSGEKTRFTYEYDFGDTWLHDIIVEKILPPEEGMSYPICIKGKLACPPDDIGGVWGYYGFLEAIQDPNHPEHDDMLEWLGEDFDPEAFDISVVNQELNRLK